MLRVDKVQQDLGNGGDSVEAREKRSKSPPQSTTRGVDYEMVGFVDACITRCLELAGLSIDTLQHTLCPGLEDSALQEQDFSTTGALSGDAAKIITKILFCARVCGCDLMHPVCTLAREISKCSRASDKRLHKLISYMHSTRDWSIRTVVGDAPHACKLVCFSDSDFAGDTRTSKSTTGCVVAISGPNTFVPINVLCKRQQVVSHSSTEAEIVALDVSIRTEGLPMLTL